MCTQVYSWHIYTWYSLACMNTWSALDKPLRPLEWSSKLVSTYPQSCATRIDLAKEYPGCSHHLLSRFQPVEWLSRRASEEHSNRKKYFLITFTNTISNLCVILISLIYLGRREIFDSSVVFTEQIHSGLIDRIQWAWLVIHNDNKPF